MKLKHPVQTLGNKLLMPAGASISVETLESLVAQQASISYESTPMLQFSSIRADILNLLRLFPYRRIFPNDDYIMGVLGEMEAVNVALPILQTIEYFRQRDFYTYRHILMVFALSTLMAKDLILDQRERINLIAAGPTHDIGKTCVPLDILKKSTPLTRTQLGVLQNHAVAGHVLLSYYLGDSDSLAARVARDHHERRDGSGYPRGIKQEDIMVEIIATCDVYDALIAPRPYRPVPYENRTALEELSAMAERGSLGWDVVRALVNHNRKTMPHYCESMFSAERRGIPPSGNLHGIIVGDDNEGLYYLRENI